MHVMSEDLSARRQQILRALIEEHVTSAAPVSSDALVHRRGLQISSATVRNELSVLEELGLIYQPHTSAGRVPSEQGYRYYVQHLVGERLPAPDEQRLIDHQFYQVTLHIEEWLRLAVSIMARTVQNAAIASSAETGVTTVRHIEIVSLHDTVALVVLVTRGATVSQQVANLSGAASQDELSAVARKLTALAAGKMYEDIRMLMSSLAGVEQQVCSIVFDLLRRQDDQSSAVLYHDGLANLLSQPEFTRMPTQEARQERMRSLLQLVEGGNVLRDLVPHVMQRGSVQVLIGEQQLDTMRDCTIILAPYGNRHGTSGIIGVVGPTRMDYGRTLGVVRYVSAILSALSDEVSAW